MAWGALPARVRAAIESRLGSPVISATTQPAGFSPGLAVRVQTEAGGRAFVKAVAPEPNPLAPRFHRREARNVAALPESAPVPRLRWVYDEGESGWIALGFEDVEGRHPATPWRPDELDRVLAAHRELGAALTPSPVPEDVVGTAGDWMSANGRGWRRLLELAPAGRDAWSTRHAERLAALETRAPAAAAGSTLLHFDLRADNVLLTPHRVVFVDWPHARVGASWVDLVVAAPCIAMQGGPHPSALLARDSAARSADPDAVTAVVAAIAGFFTRHSLEPAPPGLPTLRAFQAGQAEIARGWLADRTGWC